MIKRTSIIIALLMSACSWIKNKEAPVNEVSTMPKMAVSSNERAKEMNSELLGVWTNGNSKNATFEIREDSIYYIDHLKSYKYSVIQDSIIIMYDGFMYTGKIYFSDDTLLLTSKNEISKFWKFKH